MPYHGNLLRISILRIVPCVSRFRTSKILIARPSLRLKYDLLGLGEMGRDQGILFSLFIFSSANFSKGFYRDGDDFGDDWCYRDTFCCSERVGGKNLSK